MPDQIPVNHDPWAPSAPSYDFIPVDHDPFATAADIRPREGFWRRTFKRIVGLFKSANSKVSNA